VLTAPAVYPVLKSQACITLKAAEADPAKARDAKAHEATVRVIVNI
jgi:hypothetical protein